MITAQPYVVDKYLYSNIITHFATIEGIMFISLVRMPADGLRFEHQYQAGELDTRGFDFELQGPVSVTGRVDRAGMDMRLRGEIKASLVAPCDRCLREVPLSLDIPFDLLYAPEDPGANRTGEIELQERDLDFSVYQNDEIDLDELVLEQLELSLPSRVLCREDCQGLCPQCGADLNTEKCNCPENIDPRWQALADLKEEAE
jgi:DUF177 domain-containing protein